MKTERPGIVGRYLGRKAARIQAEAGTAPPSAWTDFNFLFSFGLTLAVMLFLSVELGTFLGDKLDCGPWAVVVLGALSVVGTLRVMVREALARRSGGSGEETP